jgi:hypothetical protein
MDNLSYFESRSGIMTSCSEEVFGFVTDMRNFERFVPAGTVNSWQADIESCSFSVSMLGTVKLKISDKEMFNRVVYYGDALKKNDFSLVMNISGEGSGKAEVKISLNADLNPMMKAMAAKPIAQFLDILICEMEKFDRWKDTKG